jgi:hypothetical protein
MKNSKYTSCAQRSINDSSLKIYKWVPVLVSASAVLGEKQCGAENAPLVNGTASSTSSVKSETKVNGDSGQVNGTDIHMDETMDAISSNKGDNDALINQNSNLSETSSSKSSSNTATNN